MQVLLLCGPPGLGKTTLAHVAAKHCGYRVVEVGFPTWDTSLAFHETGQDPLYCSKGNNRYFLSEFSDIWVSTWSQINASDDRVATTLQAKILDAIQMKSVTGDKRPNCLVSTLQQDLSLMTPDWKEQICYLWTAYLHSRKSEWFVLHDIQVIDEIDGIMGGTEGKGAVDALVEMVGLKTLPCRSVKCIGLCQSSCKGVHVYTTFSVYSTFRFWFTVKWSCFTAGTFDVQINAEKNLPQQKENEAEDGFIRKGSKKKGHTAVHRLSRPVSSWMKVSPLLNSTKWVFEDRNNKHCEVWRPVMLRKAVSILPNFGLISVLPLLTR
jgi:hypothetical protein